MKEKLWSIAMFTLCIVFPVMLGAAALYGCAHVAPVVKQCVTLPTDVDTALADLQGDNWEAALEQLVIAKGLCVVNAAVRQVVTALGSEQLATTGPDVVSRGRQWLAAHP